MRRDAATTYRQRAKDKSIWIHRRCELMFARQPPLQPRLQRGGRGGGGGGKASHVIRQSRHHNRQGRTVCDEPCSPASMVCWPFVPLGELCAAVITAPRVLWPRGFTCIRTKRKTQKREHQKHEKETFLEEWEFHLLSEDLLRVDPNLHFTRWNNTKLSEPSHSIYNTIILTLLFSFLLIYQTGLNAHSQLWLVLRMKWMVL